MSDLHVAFGNLNLGNPSMPADMDAVLKSLESIGFNLTFHGLSVGDRFGGDPKKFRRWLKELDRIYIMSGGQESDSDDVKSPRMKQIAFYMAKGPVADMLGRRSKDDPTEKWKDTLKELKRRYSSIIDASSAQALLRDAKRKNNQSVADFAEWVLEIASDAYPGVDLKADAIQLSLIDVFIRGVNDHHVIKKLIKEQKDDSKFLDMVKLATSEAELTKKMEARLGKQSGSVHHHEHHPVRAPSPVQYVDPRHEPMDINAIRRGARPKTFRGRGNLFGRGRGVSTIRSNPKKDFVCYGCNEPNDHFVKNCPNTEIVCHNCGQKGHKIRFCKHPKTIPAGFSGQSLPGAGPTSQVRIRGQGRGHRGRSSRGRGRFARGRGHGRGQGQYVNTLTSQVSGFMDEYGNQYVPIQSLQPVQAVQQPFVQPQSQMLPTQAQMVQPQVMQPQVMQQQMQQAQPMQPMHAMQPINQSNSKIH